jgi:hypothetical protein
MSNILYVINEKRAFIDTLEKFQQIENPTIYQRLAYRYELDQYINRAARYLQNLIVMRGEVEDEMNKQDLTQEEPPPIILAKIEERMQEYNREFPNMTQEQRNRILAGMFDEEGEFYGLYDNETGKINKAWVEEYLSYEDNMPDSLDIELTPEMLADVEAIYARTDIDEDEKEFLKDALFAEGGKYEGYIQEDGTCDITKVVQRQINELEASSL